MRRLYFVIIFFNSAIFSANAQPGGPGGGGPGGGDPDAGCPTQYIVEGGGVYCSGGQGVSITLSDSETGITYQLKNGTANVGSPVVGTGASLIWTNVSDSGSYTIDAINTSNCTVAMTGSATITVNPLPNLYVVSGGGFYPGSGAGLTISLSNSQAGVSYQLKRDGVNIGSPLAGTNSSLYWTNQTAVGTYTVVATGVGSCMSTMIGSAVITFGMVADEVELQILKNIYDSLGGTTWTNKGGWPTPGSWPASATAAQMDSWWGVVVSKGDITGLSLYNNNLTGQIPKTISQLTKLNNISFQSNLIAGPIPSTLGNLTNLTTLNLHNNKLTGTIPTTLNSLTNLLYLWVSNNLLTGDIPNLGGLTNLRQLYLGTNSYNPGPIPSWTNNLTLLNILDLTNSKRNGTIPSSLGNMTTLTSLILGTNQLTGSIPSSLGSLSNLQYLYLNNNQFTSSIPESLGNLSNLISLYLYSNQLKGPIPSTLGNLKKLQYLYLYSNQLTGTIPSSLGGMTALINLYLQTNQLSGSIPSALGSLGNLSVLYLAANQLTGNIPTELGNLSKLTQLYLHSNKLTGPIPTTLGNLTNLTHLYLSTNQLTGELPSSLGSLTKLAYFYGGTNQLTGSIPSSYANWINIYLFDISISKFAGALPDNLFSSWAKLVSFNISNNNFTGSFPSSISNSVLLTTLNASINKFTSLPGSILSLPVSTTINLDANDLTSAPNFGTHVNKVNLTLTVRNNYLDFSNLEPLVGAGIKTLTHTPQKDIVDVSTIDLQQTFPLVINTRPTGIASTVTWEKLGANGVTWASVTGNDQDAVPSSFTRTSATVADEGTYRWKMTNTTVTSITLQSSSIVVKTAKRFAMDQWAFQYKYDARQRMIAKKVPGADWVYMVYDKRDRLVLSQDAEQRKVNRWSFTKYDALNRPIMTGVYTHGSSVEQAAMTGLINATSFSETYNGVAASHGYTNLIFPTASLDVLTVTYYDDYSFKALINDVAFNYVPNDIACLGGETYCQDPSENIRLRGLVTGTKVKVIGFTYLYQANYYDDKYRPIQNIAHNFKGGIDRQTSVLDFSGKVLKTKATHAVAGGAPLSTNRKFEYDHTGRLLKTWHSMNASTPILLAQNEYNELGQLVDKKQFSTDGSTFKQSVDYRYNIRGWLTSINNSQLANDQLTNDDTGDLFGMELGYNNPLAGLNNTSMFNGNISAMKWSVNQGLSTPVFGTPTERAYNFTYDPLNRLQAASHLDNIGDWATSTSFNEDNLTYDYNGNIRSLNRKAKGGSVMDVLDYNYGSGNGFSNQLLKVADTGDKLNGFVDGANPDNDYAYDANGNMLIDKNKGIITSAGGAGIVYNYLNLPERVNKSSGDYIKYIYDATGRKLRQEVYNVSNILQKTTDYLGEFVYENSALQFINHEEGRLTVDGVWQDSPQLVTNTDCNDVSNFGPYSTSNITLSTFVNGSETYLKVQSNQNSGTPGVVSSLINVQPGQQYQLKVKGYRGTGNVYLYVQNPGGGNILWAGALLPAGPASEGWVSNNFVVPVGTTQVRVGALWNVGVLNDAFYINKIEVKKSHPTQGTKDFVPTAYEYQYHLKDHLGNVRLTFTTKDDIQANTATMEAVNSSTEQGQFSNYAEAIKVNSPIFDHTNAGPTYYSARLTGTASEKIGLAKSLSVMPGDKIDIEVFAKYLDTNPANLTTALAAFIASIATGGAPAGTIIDGGYAGSLGNGTFPFPNVLVRTGDAGTGPKAYLNYLLFDRDYVYKTGGFKRLSSAVRETGTDIPHERLAFDGTDQILIREPGYAYIWLSNENDTPVEVYFDDFKVTHTKSPVVASDDYYPFGLAFNSYIRENSVPNKFKFQGQEHIDDLGLGWDSFKWRNHQPDIGRFFNTDPLSEKYFYNSTYAFSENKVTTHVELEGLEAFGIHGTWSTPDTWQDQDGIGLAAAIAFGNHETNFEFDWSPARNNSSARSDAAEELIQFILDNRSKNPDEPITIIGQSHGGNLGTIAINKMKKMKEFEGIDINLFTINTPVREDYQLKDESVDHLNIYDPADPVQANGGNDPNSKFWLNSSSWNPQIPYGERRGVALTGEFGPAGRTFKNAVNIKVQNSRGYFGDYHNSHNHVLDWLSQVPDFEFDWNKK